MDKNKADIQHLDIWDIEMRVGEGGEIQTVGDVKVYNKNKKQDPETKKLKTPFITLDKNGDEVKSKIWNRKLVNYCSIGIGARIGLGFDKRRTKSRLMNKAVYGLEGCKKLCCVGGGGNIKDKIERMEVLVDIEDKKNDMEATNDQKGEELALKKNKALTQKFNADSRNEGLEIVDDESIKKKKIGNWNVVTKTIILAQEEDDLGQKGSMIEPPKPKTTSKKLKDFNKRHLLKFNPVNLILLNINSFGGGIQDMWNKSNKRNIGVYTVNDKYASFKQKPNDGKIEFISFNNRFYFGLCERGCTGGGRRMAQGKQFCIYYEIGRGPFVITFKEFKPQKKGKKERNKLYFQVDGEYLLALQPKLMKIGLSADLPDGKVLTFIKTGLVK